MNLQSYRGRIPEIQNFKKKFQKPIFMQCEVSSQSSKQTCRALLFYKTDYCILTDWKVPVKYIQSVYSLEDTICLISSQGVSDTAIILTMLLKTKRGFLLILIKWMFWLIDLFIGKRIQSVCFFEVTIFFMILHGVSDKATFSTMLLKAMRGFYSIVSEWTIFFGFIFKWNFYACIVCHDWHL